MSTTTTFLGSLSDVAGIEIGHFTETRRPTGCSTVAGVAVSDAAPGTRA